MNYLLKSKPRGEHKMRLVAVVLLFVFLNFFGLLFPNWTRSFFTTLAKPIWSVSSGVVTPFKGLKNYFISKNNLAQKNLELERELEILRLKEIDHELLTKENEELKNQLGRTDSSSKTISKVLSRPPRSPYDTLVIDVGSVHNVSIGNEVYAGENIIIGKIKDVSSGTSVVELFSKGDLKQESVLLRTGASFTLVGKGGTNFEIEVPKDTDILWGDVFIYPDITSAVLGKVYYIDTSSQSSFKTVYLRIPGNIFQTQWVFVKNG